eukprot:TRINITY_DN3321_c0_g1_i16.p1 TRINITY_DN3321_c0_g1~~TRINITY_DN3321_c0_g1_i16.p1  ORF type:complete len:343 (-),score=29.31 TRINITY_DN3321_c0_g1_i16:371-1312(-)
MCKILFQIISLCLIGFTNGFIGDVLSVRNQIPQDPAVIGAHVVNKRPSVSDPIFPTLPLPTVPVPPQIPPPVIVPPTKPVPKPTPTPPTILPIINVPTKNPPVVVTNKQVVLRPVVTTKHPKVVVTPTASKKTNYPDLVIVDDKQQKVDKCTSIGETALATPALSILARVLNQTNLLDTLSNKSMVATVFAPTDRAFQKLATKFNTTLKSIVSDPYMRNILVYHVVQGAAVLSSELEDGAKLTTPIEQDLTVSLGKGVTIIGMDSSAKVVKPDILACKSVVHIIDEVLLPNFDMLARGAAKVASQPEPETTGN